MKTILLKNTNEIQIQIFYICKINAMHYTGAYTVHVVTAETLIRFL